MEEKEYEFGAIDNTGDIALLDDEELNQIGAAGEDGGISFESIIGGLDDETKETPVVSTYSTQELNELEKMINESESAKDKEVEAITDDVDDITLTNLTINPDDVVDTKLDLDDTVVIEPAEEEPVVEEKEEPTEEVAEEPEVVETVEEETKEEEPVKEEKADFNDLDSTGITLDLENIRALDVEDDFTPFSAETFEDPMDDVNMDDLLDKASKNAQEASNIFTQNLELRRQIDEKYSELIKLTEEQEKAKNAALTEIENYKNEVYEKLKQQKADVEEKIAELKLIQNSIEQDRDNFEKYRVEEIEKINKYQQEQKAAFEQERAEIAAIEEKLVARKNRLDQERDAIRAEREKFDQERKNLQINLRKFNELVGGFTTGIDQFTNTKPEEEPKGE